VLLCAHGMDANSAHFFYLPPNDRDGGWYFTQPDGSRQGPARWIVICDDCFVSHSGDALSCPITADFRWPEGFRMPIKIVDDGPS